MDVIPLARVRNDAAGSVRPRKLETWYAWLVVAWVDLGLLVCSCGSHHCRSSKAFKRYLSNGDCCCGNWKFGIWSHRKEGWKSWAGPCTSGPTMSQALSMLFLSFAITSIIFTLLRGTKSDGMSALFSERSGLAAAKYHQSVRRRLAAWSSTALDIAIISGTSTTRT